MARRRSILEHIAQLEPQEVNCHPAVRHRVVPGKIPVALRDAETFASRACATCVRQCKHACTICADVQMERNGRDCAEGKVRCGRNLSFLGSLMCIPHFEIVNDPALQRSQSSAAASSGHAPMTRA